MPSPDPKPPRFARSSNGGAAPASPITFGATAEESPDARTARIRTEIQHKRPNGHFSSAVVWDEIKNRDGRTQAVVHIGNPYSTVPLIKTIPTEMTKEQVDAFCSGAVWTRETCQMIMDMAAAYEKRMPTLIQGESAIGKSFAVNLFSKLLSGRKPETFDCNGQTDSGDLMAKPVPNTGGGGPNPALVEFLNGPYAQEQMALSLKNASGVPDAQRAQFLQKQLANLVASSGLGNEGTMFTVQLGAIPKAMCWAPGPDGTDLYPEKGGTGRMLHIQEVTMAKPAIINILLALRGDGRSLATNLQLWQDKGQIIHAGPRYWIVMTANPSDGDGFTAREPLDKALLRGCVVLRFGDLCDESWKQICEEICGFAIGNAPKELPLNCAVEYHKSPDLVKLVAQTLSTFHLEYKQALKTDPVEKEREEKIMASQDDINEVAQRLLADQVFASGGGVDFQETFLNAVRGVYLARHGERGDEFPDAFATKMDLALTSLVTDTATGSVKIGGRNMTRGQAMNLLCKNAAQPVEARAEAAAAELKRTISGLPDDLANLLG